MKILKDQKGLQPLEVAIILIAVVVVVSVFAFTMLTGAGDEDDAAELQTKLQRVLEEEGENPYVKAVFGSHPQREIREDFFALIEKDEITFVREVGVPGIPAGVTPRWSDDGSMTLHFGVGDEFFEWDTRRLWAILVHVWSLVKDVYSGNAYIPSPGERHTAETVRSFFEEEARAYKAQCLFMQEVGIAAEHPACPVLFGAGERAFRKGLAIALSSNPELSQFALILQDQASR